MKSQYAALLILSLAVAGCARSSPSGPMAAVPEPNAAKAQVQEDMLPAGALQLSNVDLQLALRTYRELSAGTVDVAEPIKRMEAFISLTNSETMSRSQVLRLFEKALHDQAGIVATRTGTNHIALSLERSH